MAHDTTCRRTNAYRASPIEHCLAQLESESFRPEGISQLSPRFESGRFSNRAVPQFLGQNPYRSRDIVAA